MAKVLDNAVSGNASDGWDFTCPGVKGSPCGDPANPDVNFSSTGWPTKAAALARGAEHYGEHVGGEPMSTLEDFRAKHNLGVNDDGAAVSLTDLEGALK